MLVELLPPMLGCMEAKGTAAQAICELASAAVSSVPPMHLPSGHSMCLRDGLLGV